VATENPFPEAPAETQRILLALHPWIREHYCCAFHGLLAFNLWQLGCVGSGLHAEECYPSKVRLQELAEEAELVYRKLRGAYRKAEFLLLMTLLGQALVNGFEETSNDCRDPRWVHHRDERPLESDLPTSEQFRFRSLAELLGTDPPANPGAESAKDERDTADGDG
jgi:hypothetical protein